jgi:hypothetical protein
MLSRRLLASVVLAGLMVGVTVLSGAGHNSTAVAEDRTATTTPVAAQPDCDRQTLTSEQEAETLAFLSEKRASLHEQMNGLKIKDPDRYAEAMRRMYRVMKRWQRMPKAVQDATNAERDAQLRIMEIIRQMRDANSDSEEKRLEGELQQAVSDHFEAEQNLRSLRLQSLEEQIRELKEQLKQQHNQRKSIIAERVARWRKAVEPVGSTTRPDEG